MRRVKMVRSSQTYISCLFLLTIISSVISLDIVPATSKLRVKNWDTPLAGQKLNIPPLATTKTKNIFLCQIKCTKTDGCIAINFGPKVGDEHTCEMLGQDRYLMSNMTSIDADWTYIGIKKESSFSDERPRSCLDLYKTGRRLNGYYKIYDNNRGELTVYCDMNSESGAAWTLVESYALKNVAHFKSAPFYANASVNEMSPNWDSYRMTHDHMTFIKTQSTHWRATCSFPTHDVVNYVDYVRAKFASFDVMNLEGNGLIRYVEYINVRGYQCIDCTTRWWQTNEVHFHTDSYHTSGCDFAPEGSVGGTGEDNFGVYNVVNQQFSCTSSPDSTTEVWFGGYCE